MDTMEQKRFEFIPAEVVNLSFAGPSNFITLNKGALHGVKPDMGGYIKAGRSGGGRDGFQQLLDGDPR